MRFRVSRFSGALFGRATLWALPLALVLGGCASSCDHASEDKADPVNVPNSDHPVATSPTMRPAPVPMNEGIRPISERRRGIPASVPDANP